MPTGPKGQKRPADVVGAAVELGRKGGKARALKLTKKQRAEIAKRAAQKRWAR